MAKEYFVINEITICGKENVKKGIKAIGNSLCERADEICEDLEDVRSITIHSELLPRRNL